MSKQKVTYASQFENHPIQTDKSKNHGCIENIVDGYLKRLEYMKAKHRQTVVTQLVATMPQDVDPTQANKIICRCLEGFKKNMNNNGIDIQYGWVRETLEHQSDSDTARPHYHIGIIANGSKIQSAVTPAKHLDRLLAKQLGGDSQTGYIHYCKPNAEKYDKQAQCKTEMSTAIKIRRDKPFAEEQTDNALNWLSYAGKISQKGNVPYRQREFGFTRIPKEE